jgi:hypothetical protein
VKGNLYRIGAAAVVCAAIAGGASVGALADETGTYVATPAQGFTFTVGGTPKGDIGFGGVTFALHAARKINISIKDAAVPSVNATIQFGASSAGSGGTISYTNVGDPVDLCNSAADNVPVPDGADSVSVSVYTGGLNGRPSFACGGPNAQGTEGTITVSGAGISGSAAASSGSYVNLPAVHAAAPARVAAGSIGWTCRPAGIRGFRAL